MIKILIWSISNTVLWSGRRLIPDKSGYRSTTISAFFHWRESNIVLITGNAWMWINVFLLSDATATYTFPLASIPIKLLCTPSSSITLTILTQRNIEQSIRRARGLSGGAEAHIVRIWVNIGEYICGWRETETLNIGFGHYLLFEHQRHETT